jgi:hypothetical protein
METAMTVIDDDRFRPRATAHRLKRQLETSAAVFCTISAFSFVLALLFNAF